MLIITGNILTPSCNMQTILCCCNILAHHEVLLHFSVTGIFVLLKNCPRIKIFRKFLSYGIKYFVLGQKFSENFYPRTKNFRKFLSYPNKICPTPYRTKIFRKVSENFCPKIKVFSKASESFYWIKIFRKVSDNFYPRINLFRFL